MSQILNAAEIPLSKDKVLFADFSDFDDQFLKPLDGILLQTPSYQPENSFKLEKWRRKRKKIYVFKGDTKYYREIQ